MNAHWWTPLIGGRRFVYSMFAYRGRWTWGLGVDREGVGIYLGPFSAWLIWKGR